LHPLKNNIVFPDNSGTSPNTLSMKRKSPLANRPRAAHTSTAISRWTRTLLSFCAIGLPLGAGLAMGYAIGHQPQNAVEDELGTALRERMRVIDPTRSEPPHIDGLAGRMAALELRVEQWGSASEPMQTPLKYALEEPLGAPPAADSVAADALASQDVYQMIDRLSRQIDARQQQLDELDSWLAQRETGERTLFGARPVQRGSISSYFGARVDPFTGRRSMHQGIDFSAKPGTAIMAAGDGIVTFAGPKQAYGRVVEIDHGEGCQTRYAHSKLLVVKAGDRVRKGQVIALMGSSGRTTGSHLHFEVYKHGRPVDPFIYIHQASR
jgi:murein DD-endopeptidase MepM/ murein hydrolase activator NlpD